MTASEGVGSGNLVDRSESSPVKLTQKRRPLIITGGGGGGSSTGSAYSASGSLWAWLQAKTDVPATHVWVCWPAKSMRVHAHTNASSSAETPLRLLSSPQRASRTFCPCLFTLVTPRKIVPIFYFPSSPVCRHEKRSILAPTKTTLSSCHVRIPLYQRGFFICHFNWQKSGLIPKKQARENADTPKTSLKFSYLWAFFVFFPPSLLNQPNLSHFHNMNSRLRASVREWSDYSSESPSVILKGFPLS